MLATRSAQCQAVINHRSRTGSPSPKVHDAVNQAFENVFLGTPVDAAFRECDAKINLVLAEKGD
jgi:hypothetical protein